MSFSSFCSRFRFFEILLDGLAWDDELEQSVESNKQSVLLIELDSNLEFYQIQPW